MSPSTTAAVAFVLPITRASPRYSRDSCSLTDAFSNITLSITHGTLISRFLNSLFRDPDTEDSVSLFQSLCALLTPHSCVYINDLSIALALRTSSPAAVLAWRSLSAASPFQKKAAFAVTFYLRTHLPFSSIDLAQLLTYFTRTFPPSANIRGVALHGLSYSLRPDGVCGILLCGKPLQYAYNSAIESAKRDPSKYSISGWPVSTWPPTASHMRHPYSTTSRLFSEDSFGPPDSLIAPCPPAHGPPAIADNVSLASTCSSMPSLETVTLESHCDSNPSVMSPLTADAPIVYNYISEYVLKGASDA
ncbi:hypothetical protein BV22DRAFT_1133557 [Leucogyrophana mollusca]|uniref:Uncharacterized protein n=1 Tax=Leucogyrophana mollusca TaxID=85980 RepID=A0ACB8B2F4_9AGAM|nr:hypothetical protein BV22DRAFT_1133557 [Leucogyrophana mollusca]